MSPGDKVISLLRATALRDRVKLGESVGGTCSWDSQMFILLQFVRTGELTALQLVLFLFLFLPLVPIL